MYVPAFVTVLKNLRGQKGLRSPKGSKVSKEGLMGLKVPKVYGSRARKSVKILRNLMVKRVLRI